MNVIEVSGLKKYFGKVKAVDGISFEVKKGEIFGFLGPNGAGKTTTIRCMMGFLNPTAGKIKILGKDAHKDSVFLKRKIGYLSGDSSLYEEWTGLEHIKFVEKIKGKSKIIKKLIKTFDFDPKPKAKHLSSGNKRKLALILALMNEPEVLILDEPTVALDPLLQNTIYEILKDFSFKGTTIFMSSHNLPEVEKICGRVAIIKEGHLVAIENIKNLKEKKIHKVFLYFENKFKKSNFKIEGVEIIKEMKDGLVLNVKGDINLIIKKAAKYKLKDIEITHANLEEVFLEFYKKQQ